jgi:hypothetical protein
MKKPNRKTKLTMRTISVLFLGSALTFVALATMSELSLFSSKYPAATKLASCSLCHTSAPALNSYGKDYKQAGRNAAAFSSIEAKDSDGDGYTNLQEIQAGTKPYDAADKPTPVYTSTLEFAHFAAGGMWRSFLIVNNNASAEISGKAEFIGTDSNPITVEVDGIAENSHSFTIAKDGFLKLGINSTVGDKSGWCKVSATGTIGGMLVYQAMSGAAAISQATVLPSTRMKKFRMPMPQLGSDTIVGLALANVTDNPNRVTLGYYTPDGTLAVGTATVDLSPKSQQAKVIYQFISSIPTTQEGVLEVTSTEDLTAVGLLFVNNWAVFTSVPIVGIP